MYRFALALALIVAAARNAAALSECPDDLQCIVGDDSTCPFEEAPKCCALPTGRRRRLNFGKSEPTVGCCAEDCDFFLD